MNSSVNNLTPGILSEQLLQRETVKFYKGTYGDISDSSSYDLICCLIIHTTDKRYSKNYHTQLLDMYFSFHLHQNVNTLLNYAAIQKIPLHQPLTVSRTTNLFAPCVLNLIKILKTLTAHLFFFS